VGWSPACDHGDWVEQAGHGLWLPWFLINVLCLTHTCVFLTLCPPPVPHMARSITNFAHATSICT
jgi:hypothetical protein